MIPIPIWIIDPPELGQDPRSITKIDLHTTTHPPHPCILGTFAAYGWGNYTKIEKFPP